MTDPQSSMFAGKDVSFEDILSESELGGKPAIVSYLDTRARQLMRKLALQEEGSPTSKRLLLGLAALREAQNLARTLR